MSEGGGARKGERHTAGPAEPVEGRDVAPAPLPITQCKGCKAAIVWGRTEVQRKPVPLDAKPVRRYVRVGTDPTTLDPLFRLEVTYMPHHATCPEVAQFRRPPGGGE